jgi:microcystin-dependent protein
VRCGYVTTMTDRYLGSGIVTSQFRSWQSSFYAGRSAGSRTSAAARSRALFAIMSTTYGAGDGSTTFNLPDKTGRVSAMKKAVGTRLTTAGVGIDGGTIGAAGGGSQTLLTANLPPYTPSGSVNGSATINVLPLNVANGASNVYMPNVGAPNSIPLIATFSGTPQGGTSTPVKIAQPTIVCNYIIRVL